MPKKVVLVGVIVLLFLVACGGSPASDPAAPLNTDAGANTNTSNSNSDSSATAGAGSGSDTNENVNSADVETNSGSSEETGEEGEPADSGESSGESGMLMSGADPATGLEINPEAVVAGVEFIVRGEIASMTLTPTTAPEFVIESPAGKRYRIRSQDLANTFFEDGSQLEPHQYRQGMMAQATVFLDPNAGPAGILTSEDLTLLLADQ
jgi:hypothetical protein